MRNRIAVVLAFGLVAVCSLVAAGKQEAPKAREVVTLVAFASPANRSGLQEGWWAEVLRKEVGIQLELMPSGDQAAQKMQALMAAGELPDIVVFGSHVGVTDAIRAKLLVCLDEHLAKLPNVAKNAAKALQFYRDNYGGGTGKAYAVTNSIGPGSVDDEINWGPFLRWDLYKKLGMPEIATVEDYLPLLKKMQELEPVNADGQKVYAFSMWKDWDGVFMHQATQPSVMAGIDTGDQLGGPLPFLQVDFKTDATMSILDPASQYVRALKFYYTANQMGLVDPDSLTQRFDTALSKVEQGRILFAWWPWMVGGYNTPERTDAEAWKGFRPVLPKDYKAFWWGESPVGLSWPFAIGASTKQLDACLRYLDFMYSFEGMNLLMNGPQGVVWDLDSSGKPFVTAAGWDIIDNQKDLPGGGKLADGTAVVNSFGLSPAAVNPATGLSLSYTYWPSSKGRNPTRLMKDWQTTTGYKTTSEMLWAKEMYTLTPLAMTMVPVTPEDFAPIVSRIGDVIKTSSWRMIFAKNDAEFQSLLDEMVSKAEGLDVQKILDWDLKAWKAAKDTAKKYQ